MIGQGTYWVGMASPNHTDKMWNSFELECQLNRSVVLNLWVVNPLGVKQRFHRV